MSLRPKFRYSILRDELYNVKSVLITRSDKSIDFSKGATRARFEAQKLPLGILVAPFDLPLSCSVNLVSY